MMIEALVVFAPQLYYCTVLYSPFPWNHQAARKEHEEHRPTIPFSTSHYSVSVTYNLYLVIVSQECKTADAGDA